MWNPISSFGGHLGADVSALVDGQLEPDAAERAWAHVMHCPPCRRLVEREGWVKRQVTAMAARPLPSEQPPDRLLGSLYDLAPTAAHASTGPDGAEDGARVAQEAWAAVGELEQRGRGRRRAGIALVGAGSVSAAVLGLSALGGSPLGIGGASPGTPATSLSRGAASTSPALNPGRPVVAPHTTVHGRLPGWRVTRDDRDGVAHARAVAARP